MVQYPILWWQNKDSPGSSWDQVKACPSLHRRERLLLAQMMLEERGMTLRLNHKIYLWYLYEISHHISTRRWNWRCEFYVRSPAYEWPKLSNLCSFKGISNNQYTIIISCSQAATAWAGFEISGSIKASPKTCMDKNCTKHLHFAIQSSSRITFLHIHWWKQVYFSPVASSLTYIKTHYLQLPQIRN